MAEAPSDHTLYGSGLLSTALYEPVASKGAGLMVADSLRVLGAAVAQGATAAAVVAVAAVAAEVAVVAVAAVTAAVAAAARRRASGHAPGMKCMQPLVAVASSRATHAVTALGESNSQSTSSGAGRRAVVSTIGLSGLGNETQGQAQGASAVAVGQCRDSRAHRCAIRSR